jgi:hypothetical protein
MMLMLKHNILKVYCHVFANTTKQLKQSANWVLMYRQVFVLPTHCSAIFTHFFHHALPLLH